MQFIKYDNLTNRRFGRLIAKKRIGTKWLCMCDCGTEKLINPSNMKRGLTKSCGCLNRELTAQRSTKPFQWRKIPEYKVWQGILQRCENPNDKDYKKYGGRGIEVCEAWHVFDCFLSDMGPRPSNDFSIDRINVDGNYEPSNCRWATHIEQNRNKRNNVVIDDIGTRLADLIVQGTQSPEYQRARKRFRRGLSPL